MMKLIYLTLLLILHVVVTGAAATTPKSFKKVDKLYLKDEMSALIHISETVETSDKRQVLLVIRDRKEKLKVVMEVHPERIAKILSQLEDLTALTKDVSTSDPTMITTQKLLTTRTTELMHVYNDYINHEYFGPGYIEAYNARMQTLVDQVKASVGVAEKADAKQELKTWLDLMDAFNESASEDSAMTFATLKAIHNKAIRDKNNLRLVLNKTAMEENAAKLLKIMPKLEVSVQNDSDLPQLTQIDFDTKVNELETALNEADILNPEPKFEYRKSKLMDEL